LTVSSIVQRFSDEEAAWAPVERLRWPDGSICPHCDAVSNARYLAPKSGYRRTPRATSVVGTFSSAVSRTAASKSL